MRSCSKCGSIPRISAESLIFIIVLEASSRDFVIGLPWELPYADNLVLTTDNLENAKELRKWREGVKSRGLRMNKSKTKVLINSADGAPVSSSGVWPRVVCKKDVGGNSILCIVCGGWVLQR